MSDKSDIIAIECPLCHSHHHYQLMIRRSSFMGFAGSQDTQKKTSEKRIFTRLFTCPNNGGDFQASFALAQKSNTVVTSVDIVSVGQEKIDENSETD